MTERERLIDLLSTAGWNLFTDDGVKKQIADHLLSNGVIVPPCKVGDKIFAYLGCNTIIGAIVTRIEMTETPSGTKRSYFAIGSGSPSVTFNDECVGKTVFLTKEEAEKALKERSEGK